MSEVLRSIGLIARSLAYMSNIEFKELSLDKDQYLYVTRIFENPGIINEKLAELVVQDRTTVNKSVQKLVESGMVVKKQDVENKKIRRLYLTQKGEEAYQFLRREEIYSTKCALEGLKPEEIETLKYCLLQMEKNLQTDIWRMRQGEKREY